MICFDKGALLFIPDYLPAKQADELFFYLLRNIDWKEKEIRIFGRWVMQPRLTSWFGDKEYRYSGITLETRKWDDKLLQLKQKIETDFGYTWNHCLLNYYRNGMDSMGWHADDEKELGRNPVIASYSLGVTRTLLFCKKGQPRKKANFVAINLPHNSFLLMAGEIQHYWYHAVPRQKNIEEFHFSINKNMYKETGRINITFRLVS